MLKPRKGDPIAAEGENANARFASSPLPPSSGMMRFKSEQSELSKRKLWKSIPFQTTECYSDTLQPKFCLTIIRCVLHVTITGLG